MKINLTKNEGGVEYLTDQDGRILATFNTPLDGKHNALIIAEMDIFRAMLVEKFNG